ncbi:MAG: ferredoxin reductase [Nitrospirae bacterium]|jgi:NAD(P)H-flavin reductase|nr:ferredoxin reductase [Nitrospirota bacterium]
MAVREVLPTTLTDIIQETPRVCTFRLALPEQSPFSFRAGQFVMASIPGFLNTKGRPVRRAYSVASSPRDLEKGFLELTITRVGDGGFFSNRIHECRPGDTINIDGPYGSFILRPSDEPPPERYLFVASGSGIAPLRGMIRTILMEDRKVPVSLYYGYRSPSDFIFEKELTDYALVRSGFELVTALSRSEKAMPEESPVPNFRKGLSGRITRLLPELVREADGADIYICGPPEMVGQSETFFREAGYPEERVHKEQW